MPTSATSPQNLGAKCDDIHDDLKVIGHGSQVKGISPSSGFFTSSDETVQTSGVFFLNPSCQIMSNLCQVPRISQDATSFFFFLIFLGWCFQIKSNPLESYPPAIAGWGVDPRQTPIAEKPIQIEVAHKKKNKKGQIWSKCCEGNVSSIVGDNTCSNETWLEEQLRVKVWVLKLRHLPSDGILSKNRKPQFPGST